MASRRNPNRAPLALLVVALVVLAAGIVAAITYDDSSNNSSSTSASSEESSTTSSTSTSSTSTTSTTLLEPSTTSGAPTTTTSAPTTTAAPGSTTTTVHSTPTSTHTTVAASTPEQAAEGLWAAYTVNDRAKAARYATQTVIDFLFGTYPYEPPDGTFQGCQASSSTFVCGYVQPSQTTQLTVQKSPDTGSYLVVVVKVTRSG